MTVIDTSAMVALMNGLPGAEEKVRELMDKNGSISITIITVYELLKGAYLSTRREVNLAAVRDAILNVPALDLTPAACEEASNIFCELQKSGNLISEFDIIIAAITKANGEAILTRDKHFRYIKGLEVIDW